MKNNNNSLTKFTFIGFLLFLFPLTVSISCGVIIFNSLMNKFNNYLYVAVFLLIYIIFITLAFTAFDMIRRRLMIDKPVKQILDATQKISEGNFEIKLTPIHEYGKYDEYDLIMENINKMAKELSKSEILKNDFISNVSHEIKTPLSLIQNYSKALLGGKLDDETRKKYLQSLIDSTNKISNLITNILKLNKLENQSIVAVNKSVNIGEVLRLALIQFEDKFSEKNITLNAEIDDIIQNIDSSYLDIIFNNLISNAIKFTKTGGKIDIFLTSNNSDIIFKISDNGIGMKEEVGVRIFDKFYQGDKSHASEGAGLGLTLVKRIIDILGGEIVVESEEDVGSTFTVKIKKNLYS